MWRETGQAYYSPGRRTGKGGLGALCASRPKADDTAKGMLELMRLTESEATAEIVYGLPILDAEKDDEAAVPAAYIGQEP
jgi:hypothetical protein